MVEVHCAEPARIGREPAPFGRAIASRLEIVDALLGVLIFAGEAAVLRAGFEEGFPEGRAQDGTCPLANSAGRSSSEGVKTGPDEDNAPRNT